MEDITKHYVYEGLTILGFVWGGPLILIGHKFLGVISIIVGWYFFQKLTLLIHRDLKEFTTVIEIVRRKIKGEKWR